MVREGHQKKPGSHQLRRKIRIQYQRRGKVHQKVDGTLWKGRRGFDLSAGANAGPHGFLPPHNPISASNPPASEQAHLRGGAQLYLVGASAAVRYFSTVGMVVYSMEYLPAGWIFVSRHSTQSHRLSDSHRPRQPWSNRTGLEEARDVRYGDELRSTYWLLRRRTSVNDGGKRLG